MLQQEESLWGAALTVLTRQQQGGHATGQAGATHDDGRRGGRRGHGGYGRRGGIGELSQSTTALHKRSQLRVDAQNTAVGKYKQQHTETKDKDETQENNKGAYKDSFFFCYSSWLRRFRCVKPRRHKRRAQKPQTTHPQRARAGKERKRDKQPDCFVAYPRLLVMFGIYALYKFCVSRHDSIDPTPLSILSVLSFLYLCCLLSCCVLSLLLLLSLWLIVRGRRSDRCSGYAANKQARSRIH